jgi:hypothetical protein
MTRRFTATTRRVAAKSNSFLLPVCTACFAGRAEQGRLPAGPKKHIPKKTNDKDKEIKKKELFL